MSAYADFVAGIAGLTIAGVNRRYLATPGQLTAADLPASFPQIPDDATSDAPITADGQGGWPRLAVELVIVVKPTRQGTPDARFAETVAMIDAVSVALRGVPKGSISKGPLTWTVRGGISTVGETEYWLVLARVMGTG